MADRQQQLRVLRNDRDLRRFEMTGVVATGRRLGTGSYGSVIEVKVNGLVCAGKVIHELLLDGGNAGVRAIAAKYVQECQLMSELRHPNLTQFLGLCFLPNTPLPMLVMERLEGSLDDLLETIPNIPLALKRSMLEDIARGLLYLHTRDPPIIHRDLTARNVLLTSSFVAKITDLGNSRMVNVRPGQLTQTPGTHSYMPPEAMDDTPQLQYGPPLDVFSFGHLGLFTALQVFPGTLRQPNFPDPDNPGRMLGRTEVERRGDYFQQLEGKLPGGSQHPLISLVKGCLHNIAGERPTAEQLLTSLGEMKAEIEGPFDSHELMKLHVMKQVAITKTLKQADTETQRLQTELQHAQGECLQKDQQLQEKDRQLTRIQQEMAQNQEQWEETLHRKHVELNQMAVEKFTIESTLRAVRQQSKQLEDMLATAQSELEFQKVRLVSKETELERMKVENGRLIEELQRCEAQLQAVKSERVSMPQLTGERKLKIPLSERKLPLKINWQQRKMPFEMWGYPCAVVIGRYVYIGGGIAHSEEHRRTVLRYNVEADEWHLLPEYDYQWFSMTAVNQQLVLVGGYDPLTGKTTNRIAVFDEKSQKWTHPYYPPLHTACESPSVFTYKDFIITAGGRDNARSRMSRVEIYNVSTRQRYQCHPLPGRCCNMTSSVISGVYYVIGGLISGGDSMLVFTCNIDELISAAVSGKATTSPWTTIASAPLYGSTGVSIYNSLLTLGGNDQMHVNPSIHLYNSTSKQWVKMADLPTGRSQCACTVLHNGDILVAGGFGAEHRLDIGRLVLL